MIDLSRSRLTPYHHQYIGVEKIVNNPFFFLADDMGAGKTKQAIDAAQVLNTIDLIDRVIVVAPASVRFVWFDPELGELIKHLWVNMPCVVTEYHAKIRSWQWFIKVDGKEFAPKLFWTITNYDFIRNKDRLEVLLKVANKKTLLILDESASIKSWRAIQTKSCEELRARCGRILLLNGMPISNNPGDLYSQAHIMDPKILGCKSFFHFRARYAIMGGWQQKQIVAWRDLDDLQKRLAPYILRRLKEHCIDLPRKLDPVIITVPLSNETWKIYKEMRDEMVAWLSESSVSAVSQAIVKAIRLAQLTSGFIGGVEIQEKEQEDKPDWIPSSNPEKEEFLETNLSSIREIGREKLDIFFEQVEEWLEADPNLKLLVWGRFRPEVKRLYEEFIKKYPNINCEMIWGGQKRNERDAALRLLDPRTAPKGPAVVIGTPASGSLGLNLAATHTAVYISNDFSLKTRAQSEDRIHRPGQVYPVSYFDIIATGPQGQKTIDHLIIKALKTKLDIANFTTSAWIAALMED